MELPTYTPRKRIKRKVCQEPGCGKTFWGHPIAKYCEEHSDIKQRQKPKKEFDTLEMRNMLFKHNYLDPIEVPFKCCLDGCNNSFSIKVFPKQYVYPRFCLEHRNDFKRKNFIRLQNK
ncbi:hypothetical protein AGMMS49938_07220 [Fibrobacterales bacterium]|nr:hypothetical protein AGMMS49938_07220 [Fibrobacterales bacterium]